MANMFDKPKIGQELLDVPMGDMIQQMAFAIAEAQRKLDENSIETAQMMGGLETIVDDETGEVRFNDSRVFFGKEKFILADAIAAHNQTSDIAIRANIRQGLGTANFTESNLLGMDFATIQDLADLASTAYTTGATTYPTAATVSLTQPDKIYRTGNGSTSPYKYYSYNSTPTTGPRVYTEVSQYASTIAKLGTLADNTVFLVPSRISMLELGFSPTFYQFVDTIIEVKISIKYTQDGAVARNQAAAQANSSGKALGLRGIIFGGRRSSSVTTSHVNATYSQKFSYSAEGSSLLRTKLVPIPPPAILEERIRLQMDLVREESSTQPIPTV
jgi:hypothetical protein